MSNLNIVKRDVFFEDRYLGSVTARRIDVDAGIYFSDEGIENELKRKARRVFFPCSPLDLRVPKPGKFNDLA